MTSPCGRWPARARRRCGPWPRRLPERSGAHRDGDLLARLVGDVDAVQDLYLRGLHPAAGRAGQRCGVGGGRDGAAAGGGRRARGRARRRRRRRAAAGRRARRVHRSPPGRRARRAHRRPRRARRAVRPSSSCSARTRPPSPAVERLDAQLRGSAAATRSPAVRSRASRSLVAGSTAAGVLAVCVRATADDRLDRVLVAALTLLAAAAFEAVAPLPAAALTLHATLESARRVLQIADRPPAVPRPVGAGTAPGQRTRRPRWIGRAARQDADGWGLRDVDLALAPGERVALVGQSGSGKTTLAELMVRFLDPDDGGVLLAGTDVRDLAQQRRAAADHARRAGRPPLRDVHPRERPAGPPGRRRRGRRGRRCAGPGSATGVAAARTGPTRSSARTARRSPAVSGAGSRWPAPCSPTLPVLVLDEPTAHVDHPTAAELIQDVLAAAPDRTVLLITHREDEARLTQRVLRLRRGRIIPGSFDPGMTTPRARRGRSISAVRPGRATAATGVHRRHGLQGGRHDTPDRRTQDRDQPRPARRRRRSHVGRRRARHWSGALATSSP